MKLLEAKGRFFLILIYSLIILLFCFSVHAKEEKAVDREFKVVGYYSGDLFNEPVEKLQTDKLTHIMYSFVIPKEDGTLHDLKNHEQLKDIVKKAHADNAEVFISLGGWSYEGRVLEPVFKELAASDEKRKKFIKNVCDMVEEYDLDGVELDWEHPNKSTADDYEKLVVEMSDALKLKDKELSAALNGSWYVDWAAEDTSVITKKCLDRFSFINVMAYDMNNEEHSPIWFFENSISYWINRGLPPEKLVMGIPLYAKPSWKQYRHLIAENSEYAYSDYAPTVPLTSYYNGMNTIREKTIIALNRAGGVMLFDVNEDTNDQYSIVSMIDDILTRTEGLSKEELKKYVTIVFNKKELKYLEEEGFGMPFINNNNRVMIPLRKSLEAIDAEVTYDNINRVVTVKKDGVNIKVPISKNIIDVDGKIIKMDTAAILKDNRIYIPLRTIFEAFGYNIEYHSNSKTVIVSN